MATAADRLGAPNSELDHPVPARPCGCKSGAALSLGALVAWPVWTFMFAPPKTLLEVGVALVSYVLIVVGAGLVGKVAGIAFGRWRQRRVREQLAHRLTILE